MPVKIYSYSRRKPNPRLLGIGKKFTPNLAFLRFLEVHPHTKINEAAFSRIFDKLKNSKLSHNAIAKSESLSIEPVKEIDNCCLVRSQKERERIELLTQRNATRLEATASGAVKIALALLKGNKVRLPNGKIIDGKTASIRKIAKIAGMDRKSIQRLNKDYATRSKPEHYKVRSTARMGVSPEQIMQEIAQRNGIGMFEFTLSEIAKKHGINFQTVRKYASKVPERTKEDTSRTAALKRTPQLRKIRSQVSRLVEEKITQTLEGREEILSALTLAFPRKTRETLRSYIYEAERRLGIAVPLKSEQRAIMGEMEFRKGIEQFRKRQNFGDFAASINKSVLPLEAARRMLARELFKNERDVFQVMRVTGLGEQEALRQRELAIGKRIRTFVEKYS